MELAVEVLNGGQGAGQPVVAGIDLGSDCSGELADRCLEEIAGARLSGGDELVDCCLEEEDLMCGDLHD